MPNGKTHLRELAIRGGEPAFAAPLHVGRPNIGDRHQLLARINQMLDRRWLTNAGPFVQEFEEKICSYVGVKHCIAMCNATIALEIAIRALGLKDEVIVPSFTFIATAHALQWQEITPVFCDIDPNTHCLDVRALEKMITPRTSGIIGVHVWGRACNLDALESMARNNGLKLLFDAAHAFGCSHQGKMIGNFGEAEVYSFHATKFLNSFEGGAVVTNDDQLAAKIRLMTNFGFAGYDNVVYIGTNGKMSEASAAMGLTGLESIDSFISVNHRNYKQYAKLLSHLPGFKMVEYDSANRCNYQYVVFEVTTESPLSRDELIEVLRKENVLARKYFYPGCHRMEPYRSKFPGAGELLPNTERLCHDVLVLPTGTAVGVDEISSVAAIICQAIAQADLVKQSLGRHA